MSYARMISNDEALAVDDVAPRVELGQKRRQSVLESMLNVMLGYVISIASGQVIFPLFGIPVPLSSNLGIGVAFAVVSLVRSYLLRRAFSKATPSYIGQKPWHSVQEVLLNILIGYVIGVASGALIFPMFGVAMTLSSNLGVTAAFSGVSLVRSYVLRRLFNLWQVRSA